LDPDHIQRALATRSTFYASKVVQRIGKSKASMQEKQNTLFAIEVNRMTKLHLIYIMYERARATIASQQIQDANVRRVYMTILANFALKYLQ